MRFKLDSNRKKVALVLVALLMAACSMIQSKQSSKESSSSSSGSDSSTSSGPCKNVDICNLIPQSKVNEALGVMAKSAVPDEPTNAGGMTSDHCAYLNPVADTNVQLLRQCYPDVPGHPEIKMASGEYKASKEAYLKPGGTRDDLSGVGDQAFYETVPGQSAPKVRLVTSKGNLYVIVSDEHVPAGQEAMVKQGLVSFANSLLNAK